MFDDVIKCIQTGRLQPLQLSKSTMKYIQTDMSKTHMCNDTVIYIYTSIFANPMFQHGFRKAH